MSEVMFRIAYHTTHTAVYSIYTMHSMHILWIEYLYDLLGLVKTNVHYENRTLWGILSPTMQCKISNLPFSSVTDELEVILFNWTANIQKILIEKLD